MRVRAKVGGVSFRLERQSQACEETAVKTTEGDDISCLQSLALYFHGTILPGRHAVLLRPRIGGLIVAVHGFSPSLRTKPGPPLQAFYKRRVHVEF